MDLKAERKIALYRAKQKEANRLNGECVNMPNKGIKMRYNGTTECLLASLSFTK